MIISLAYAGISVMLCARPVYTHLFTMFTGKHIGGKDDWVSYIAMFAVTIVLICLPMRMGVRALARMEIQINLLLLPIDSS